jgi:hypothetical protein
VSAVWHRVEVDSDTPNQLFVDNCNWPKTNFRKSLIDRAKRDRLDFPSLSIGGSDFCYLDMLGDRLVIEALASELIRPNTLRLTTNENKTHEHA